MAQVIDWGASLDAGAITPLQIAPTAPTAAPTAATGQPQAFDWGAALDAGDAASREVVIPNRSAEAMRFAQDLGAKQGGRNREFVAAKLQEAFPDQDVKFLMYAADQAGQQASDQRRQGQLGQAVRETLEATPSPGTAAALLRSGANVASVMQRANPWAQEQADRNVALANQFEQQAEAIQQDKWAAGETLIPPIIARGGRGALSTVPQGMLMGSPAGAIGLAATQEANQAYVEGADAGLQGAELARHVVAKGAIEGSVAGIFQKAGLGGLEKYFGQGALQKAASGGLSAAMKQVGISAAQEIPEELLTEYLHNLEDRVSEVRPDALTPQSLWETTKNTFVQTVMSVGLAGAPSLAAGALTDASRSREGGSAAEAMPVPEPPIAPPTPEPEARPTPQPADVTTPEGVRQWVEDNPDTAQLVAEKESLSRSAWQVLGLPPRSSAEARSQFAGQVRSLVKPPAGEPGDITGGAPSLTDGTAPAGEAAAAATPEVASPEVPEAIQPQEQQETEWAIATRQKLGAVPVFKEAAIELDETERTARVQRPDGRSTTIHFDADDRLAAIAKKRGRKAESVHGAYVFKRRKKGRLTEGDIYLRSDAGHRTINHEVIHWLEDEGVITPEEVAKNGGREGIAVKYAAWAEKPKPNTLFKKIYDFLELVFSSQRRVFEDISKRGTDGGSAVVAQPSAVGTAPAGEALPSPAVEPPVPEGMTRMYHGSAEHGRYEGPAWFSTNRQYATDYREAAELQYVDVPTDWVNKQADPDELGQTPEKGFTFNVELDSSITGTRKSLNKPVGETTTAVVEPKPKPEEPNADIEATAPATGTQASKGVKPAVQAGIESAPAPEQPPRAKRKGLKAPKLPQEATEPQRAPEAVQEPETQSAAAVEAEAVVKPMSLQEVRQKAKSSSVEKRFWTKMTDAGKAIKGKKTDVTVKRLRLDETEDDVDLVGERIGDRLSILQEKEFNEELGAWMPSKAYTVHFESEGGGTSGTVITANTKSDAKQIIALLNESGIDLNSYRKFEDISPEEGRKIRRIQKAWEENDLQQLTEEERTELTKSVGPRATDLKADFVLDADDLGATGIPALKEGRKGTEIAKKMAREVPEFAYDPVFTVDENKKLVYRDGYKFTLAPSVFNLDESELTPGQTVGINLEDLGLKRATEQDVVISALKAAGLKASKGKDAKAVKISGGAMKHGARQEGPQSWTSEDPKIQAVLDKIRWVQPGQVGLDADATVAEVEAEVEGVEPPPQKSKGKKPPRGTAASASFRAGSSTAAGDTYQQTEAAPAGAFVSKLKGIQVPELVSLARELMGGRLPIVGGLKKYLGLFKGMEGVAESTRILLNPSIAKDERQLAAVLAHEIGHLVDFLPDATLKRGNILGRIATLRDHLKGYMANKPGGLGELTSNDRARLKRLAEKLATKGAEIEIDEEIRTTMPVTPEQIMAIWNSVDVSKLNQRLYQFVKQLSPAEKKSIVMEAIRGKVPEILQQYGEETVEKTGRKIKKVVKIDAAEVAAKYAEMVEEEIRKRELLSNAIIRKELIALTKWWSGDYAGGSSSYKSYRESSKELYAEALSVFLTTPGELESRAPMFWKGFTNYIGSKPDVLHEYMAVQEMLNGVPAELALDRSRRIRGMFTKGDEAIRAANSARDAARQSVFESVRQFLEQYVLDSHSPVKRRVAKAEKKRNAKFDDADNAKYILDELHSIDSPNHVMLSRIEREVYRPLLDAGFSRDDMGEYLFLKRVVNERNEIMNPLGFTPETSGEQLGELRTRLGAARFDELHRAMQKWHGIIFEAVEEAVETGVYSRKQFEEIIKPNKDNYATFAVTHYLENDAHISAGIFEQVGTLQEVANPLDATHMKTITLNRLIELNRAKNSVRDLLLREFSSEITAVPIPRGQREPSKPAPQGMEYMIVLEDGRPHAYQVPQEIAKSLMRHDIGGLAKIGRLLESGVYKMFHPLFVTFNPSFQIHNPIRDLRRTHLNLSSIGTRLGAKISLGQVLKAYWDAKGAAWRRARGLHDDVIERMMSERAIDIPFVSVDSTTVGDETTIGGRAFIKGPTDLLLESHGLSSTPKQRRHIMKVLGPFFDVVEGIGVFQETVSKVAGYKILEQRGVPKHERAYMVRKYVGTPDFKQRGLATGVTNSLFMYSKVRWNGLQFDSDLATSKDTAAGWWWRRMIWTLMPTTITKAAAVGLLGPAVAAMLAAVPKYFLDNYDVIPLGWVPEDDDDDEEAKDKGKVAFLTIPQDDTGRFIKNIWSHLLDVGIVASGGKTDSSGINEIAGELFGDVKSELFPSFNPAVDISLKWAEYASDVNPRDSHFGSEIVSPTEWDARYADAAPARNKMLSWTFDKFGVASTLARSVTGPTVGNPFDSESETVVEQAVRMTPGLERMIRISDRGLSEKEWAAKECEEAEAAAFRLNLPREVRDSTKYLYQLRRKDELTQTEFIEKETVSAWYNQAYLPLTEIMKDDVSTPEQVSAAREKLSDATKNMKDLYAAKAMRSIIGNNLDGTPKGRPQRQSDEPAADYQTRVEEWLDRRAKATEAYQRILLKRQ